MSGYANSAKARGVLIERAFAFTKILTSGEWVSRDMLAVRLRVSKKTVSRWLDAMEAVGYPIETVNDTGARTVFRVAKER